MNSNSQSLILTILLASLAAGLRAEVRTYDLAPDAGSRFALEVFKTRLMAGKKHVLVFERFSGKATFDDQKPEDGKVRFVVEAGSVVCTDTWVNEHDRAKITAAAEEVMEAEKFPQLIFESSKISSKGADQYDVAGTLTIHGVARPAIVHVTRKPDAFEGEAAVKLSDFGLKPPTGATLGLIGTKDEMKALFRLVPAAPR